MAGATAKQIAEKLGISTTAVSLALNDKAGVSKKTKDLIEKTARELGYTKQTQLTTKSIPPTLCFVVFVGNKPRVSEYSSFPNTVMQGVESLTSTYGYTLTIRYLNDEQIRNPYNLSFIDSVDASIVLATDVVQETISDILPLIEAIKNKPFIILDNVLLSKYGDTLYNDNFSGAFTAATHLYSKGCKTFGYFRSNQRIPTYNSRETGLISGLTKCGAKLDTIVDVRIASEQAYIDILSWLETKPKLPDGFFAENDVIAAVAIRAMNTCGITVPNDVSIIGFDDAPVAEMVIPRLTSIKSHAKEMGIWAVRMIDQRIKQIEYNLDSDLYVQMILNTALIERDSVRKK